MKTILPFIASALCSAAIITPSLAQAPAKEVVKRTTNEIALDTLNHVKSVFAASATATDAQKATTAATTLETTAVKIIALQTALKASPMPTIEEKKAFAQKMLQYEPQVSIIMKKMTNTFDNNSEEVNKIIQPAFTRFKSKIGPSMTLIEKYYPKKEMQGYMKELKGK